MRRWYSAGAVALTVLFFSALSSAQTTFFPSPQQQQPINKDMPRCSVTGVVVNSLTGEAVPRAQVSLYGQEQRTALADGEGRFTIDDVVQSSVAASARKPGFTSPVRGVQLRYQACGANADTIKIQLLPTASVVGHITDVNGDPVDEVPVRLGKYTYQDGRRHFSIASSGMTDFEGRFRLAGLEAGSYILIAGPSSPQMLVAVRDITPISYYPGVAERSAAAPIEVKPGGTVDASMVVREVQGFTVSGQVQGLASDARGISVQFTNQSGDDVGMMVGRRNSANEFLVVGVPAGNYKLRATAYQQGGAPLTGTAQVTVAHDLSNVQVSLAAPLTLRIDVRDEGQSTSRPDSARIEGPRYVESFGSIHLTNALEEGHEFYAQPEGLRTPKWTIKNIERGTYLVDITAAPNSYVQSARLKGVDLLREPVVIDSDEAPIELTVRDDAAQLSGTVEGATSAIVVAVPSGGILFPPRAGTYLRDAAASKANFQMPLPPGEYTLYAFDADGTEYSNPKVMEKYAGQGVHVSVSAREKKEVTLKPVEVTP